jgi:hypothetical protein
MQVDGLSGLPEVVANKKIACWFGMEGEKMDDRTQLETVELIGPILSNLDRDMQGAVLLALVQAWLAGYQPDNLRRQRWQNFLTHLLPGMRRLPAGKAVDLRGPVEIGRG